VNCGCNPVEETKMQNKKEEEKEEEVARLPAKRKRPSDELQCSICVEEYDQKDHRPLSLHCGHTFCHQCVKKMYQNG
jgi:hypothetical protein